MSYYDDELAKAQSELERLDGNHSAEAHARKITLLDHMASVLNDYADEIERRGHSGHELRQAGNAMKDHAVEQANEFLRILATGSK